MRHALSGIRVLDITQVMAGPYCAMLLCDMGADVIKVEAPLGDSSRRMAGAEGSDSPAFNAVNRGKRGTVIDIKTEKGREASRRSSRRYYWKNKIETKILDDVSPPPRHILSSQSMRA